VILLDTNAILFLLTAHPRAKVLQSFIGELRVSPVSLMELQMLVEVGRLRWKHRDPRDAFSDDPRWELDDPQVSALVHHALDITWTRDPFDRLLVAHARQRRWKFATSDTRILERLSAKQVVEL
jgi:PIN domain nuclease of toxin-antitoxin system